MRIFMAAALGLMVSGPLAAQDIGGILRDQVLPRLSPGQDQQRERDAYERGRIDQDRAQRNPDGERRRDARGFDDRRDERYRDERSRDERFRDERPRDRAFDDRSRTDEERRRMGVERRSDERRGEAEERARRFNNR